MTKRMLIDATHAEETRVVVLDGNRLEDFDVETQAKRQLKGNIYLAKVVRVEPSLQAAFVEYGGGRHGFLAFGEIHPDYYQIPVADRQRLLEIAAEEAREEEEAEERREAGWAVRAEAPSRRRGPEPQIQPDIEPEGPELPDTLQTHDVAAHPDAAQEPTHGETQPAPAHEHTEASAPEATPEHAVEPTEHHASAEAAETHPELAHAEPAASEPTHPEPPHEGPAQPAIMPGETLYGDAEAEPTHASGDLAETHATETADEHHASIQHAGDADGISTDDTENDAATSSQSAADDRETIEELAEADATPPETVGGESDQFEGNGAEEASRRRSSRMLRSYRIQEVIRRRQILLIQVVKEERGNKGAALTTYISLAGRYCVLMPNSPRGGGISRKITSAADRKRLKEITAEMEIPKGMGLIVRTAGAARPKPEIRRDCEYLMRLWDDIRDHTMRSMAPALIYEEASLIKRSIRDVYSRDVDEIIVDGEEGWKQAHDFMRMLMPSHAKKVQLWRPQGVATPLFAKHQVDLQLDAMLSPVVQLKSGGYLVINQTEALVAIDVNSGRSTRERGIEETALKTNLEAADELARQLRLRDLAGLIVIDFIDMEIRRSNAAVERRMKDALKNDRARIQIGAITHFGLMEMSRQRLRPSLAETSFVTCAHCTGLGLVRSVESAAIHVLRSVEEEGSKLRAAAILVHAATPVVMYLLNNKRERLGEIEARYAMRISFAGDDTLLPPTVRIDKLRAQVPEAERLLATAPVAVAARPMEDFEDEDADDLVHDEEDETAAALPPTPRPPREDRPRSHAPAEQAARAEPTDATATETTETTEEGDVRRKRRRRRRGRRDPAATDGATQSETEAGETEEADGEEGAVTETATAQTETLGASSDPIEGQADVTATLVPVEYDENGDPVPPAGGARRRGRRGGRRRRRGEGETGEDVTAAAEGEATPHEPEATVAPPAAQPPAHTPAPAPAYAGPTPANPFNNTYDIFDMLEQAEEAAAQPVAKPAPDPTETKLEVEPTSPPAGPQPVEQEPEPAAIEPQPETPPAPAKRGWWRR